MKQSDINIVYKIDRKEELRFIARGAAKLLVVETIAAKDGHLVP